MNRFTLKIDNQSVTFTAADLPAIEAVLHAAAKSPGQEVFRATESGRIMAAFAAARSPATRHSNAHCFNQPRSVSLTDC